MIVDKAKRLILHALVVFAYAFSIVSASGFFDVAQAIISCSDVVDPATGRRYSDEYTLFAYRDGKTYAISKTALGDPQGLHLWESNITRQYVYDGVDTDSLKGRVNAGRYGSAKPVSIKDQATLDFIIGYYKSYLANASDQKATYIDAWKDKGSTAVTTMAGSALAFSKWAAGQPLPSSDPMAVVMGADGQMYTTPDGGVKLSQIVEFDGKLDCALDATPIVNPPVDPTGGTGTGGTSTTPNLTAGVWCGSDLNGNGYTGDTGEMGQCISTAQGNLCPVATLDCDPTYQPAQCPSPSVLNTVRDMCQAPLVSAKCPSGYSYDSFLDRCTRLATCSGSGILNTVTDQCEVLVTNQCPAEYTYSAAEDKCIKAVGCANGGVYSPERDRCELSLAGECPSGFTMNFATQRCQKTPECAVGTYSPAYDKCITGDAVCPANYSWSSATNRCEKAPPECVAGTSYNLTTNKCEANPTCTSGTYDAATDQCESSYPAQIATVSFSVLVDYHKPTTWTCTSWDRTGCNMGDYLCGRCVASTCNADALSGKLEASGVGDACSSPTVVGYASATATGPATIPIGLSQVYGSYVVWGTTYYGCISPGNGWLVVNPTGDASCNPLIKGYIPSSSFTQSVSFPGGGGYLSSIKTSTSISNCPSGGSLSGSVCITSSASATCPSGTSLDGASDKCVANPTCTGGTFDGTADVCYASAAPCSAPSVLDAVLGKCVVDATCSPGALNVATDQCEISPTCGSGYTFNQAKNRCELTPPTCPTGSTYSNTYNKCMKPVQVCANGYSWSTARQRCEKAPECPNGTTYNVTTNSCTTATTGISSYAQQVTAKNTIIKYKARNDWNSATYCASACAQDSVAFTFTWDGSTVTLSDVNAWGGAGSCAHNSPSWEWQCPVGEHSSYGYDGAGKLTIAETYYLWYQNTDEYGNVVGSPIKGGSLGGAAASASPSEFQSCPANYTPVTAPNPTQCTQIVTTWGNYSGFTDCTNAGSYTCATSVQACPVGTTLQSGVCTVSNPTCAGGSFDGTADVCYYTATPCETTANWNYDAAAGQCSQGVECANGGTLSHDEDICIISLTDSCFPGWAKDQATGLCYASPVCSNGAYVQSSDRCEATITRVCSTDYIWDPTSSKCSAAPICQHDATFSLDASIGYAPSIDKCSSQAEHVCDAGLTWNGVPVNKCEAVPICAGAVYYDAAKDQCYMGDNSCPHGALFTCMSNPNMGGKRQCSPFDCFDTAAADQSDSGDKMDDKFLRDDAKDAEGNCLGQIYIFSGKPSRCRPPGWAVGYINNCCADGKSMTEDMGEGIGGLAMSSSLTAMSEMAKGAYYSYQGYQAAQSVLTSGGSAGGAMMEAGTQVMESSMSGTAADAFMAGAESATQGSGAISSTASGAANAGANAGYAAAGAAVVWGAGALATALGGDQDTKAGAQIAATAALYAVSQMLSVALMTGPQAIIGIVIIVVMRVLMGSGCDENDITTANFNESKRCHFVGTYCEKKWALVGCVQQAKGYCCFNSQLARIMHEQARPQFPGVLEWGQADKPNCRGFSPEEFQSIDFSRVDLSEYLAVVESDINTKVNNVQQSVTNTLERRMDDISSGMVDSVVLPSSAAQ